MFEGALIILGFVNGIRLYRESREGFWYFVAALVVGLGLGLLRLYGLNIETGIGYALVGSGLYQVGKKVGGH